MAPRSADVPIVAVVGASGSGKTTLLERLIPELIRRGRRVGAVKHTHHTFALDPRGKDSWRLFHAGAHVVAFSSSAQLAVMRHVEGEVALQDVVTRYFSDMDLVLVEGFKELPLPKIAVIRSGEGVASALDHLLAVVTDDRPALQVPTFRPGDAAGLATFLETQVLGGTA